MSDRVTPAMRIIDDMVREAMRQATPEDASAICCMQADQVDGFPDDLFDDCSVCGARVRYRPYMPDLPKVCMECVGIKMAGRH